MGEPTETFEVPPSTAKRARISGYAAYESLRERSIRDPEGFWSDASKRLDWIRPFGKVLAWEFKTPTIRWFEGGRLNVSANCLDRHVAKGRGERVAYIWEANDPGLTRRITYADLLLDVQKFANVLKTLGVRKGDRVCIYLPMIPEIAVAMLACARLGAVHTVVFAGFSAGSLRDRILDSACKVVVTADEGLRGPKKVALKGITDEALTGTPCVEKCIVVRRTGGKVAWTQGRDLWWHDVMKGAPETCPPEPMDAEDPLFILYTSGSTGKPKGVLHTTGGYLLYAALTHEWVFDHREIDIYWCTADAGWITGHSYLVYGPLANGATSVMYEGIPNHPDWGRFWSIIEEHAVTIFYTAPTALRAIAREGDAWITKHDLSSLRLLGTVGEPINPEIWRWYHRVIGRERCTIVDTWWQTETGGILISPLPGATPTKPGSATLPLPGIRPVIVDDAGKVLEGNGVSGNLCLSFPWPGMMRTVYGNHDRFRETYFSRFPGLYFTGDGCRRDEDGYYWITGRVDDVIKVSAHLLGTAEIESALVTHPAAAEAAVVGFPHEIKGQAVYAFVILKEGRAPDETLRKELVAQVRNVMGPIATPDRIQFVPGLPKTRSGKIMRRILRKIAAGDTTDLGDTSTLADPTIVGILIAGAPRRAP